MHGPRLVPFDQPREIGGQPGRETGGVEQFVEDAVGTDGFAAAEVLLAEHPSTGDFCEGETPTLADCCLIPQIYNARRFGVDMAAYPTLARIEAACLALPAVDAARPENPPDAPRP